MANMNGDVPARRPLRKVIAETGREVGTVNLAACGGWESLALMVYHLFVGNTLPNPIPWVPNPNPATCWPGKRVRFYEYFGLPLEWGVVNFTEASRNLRIIKVYEISDGEPRMEGVVDENVIILCVQGPNVQYAAPVIAQRAD